jgi:small-conductance mechanosensitive channel
MNEIIPATDAEATLTLASFLRAAIIVLAGWFAAKVATRIFKSSFRFKISTHHLAMWGRLLYYGIFALFAVTAIHQLGFDLSVLLGAAGILTVAIGFASQTSASNLISGLFLLGEKPFVVGDVLRVENDTGEVISIDLLSVKLRTFDYLYVRIPNEVLIKTKFVNLTKFPIRRIDIHVGVAYKENLDEVVKLLLSIVNEEPRCLEEPKPFCIVNTFGTSSVDLQLSTWGRKELYRELRSDLNKAVKAAFDKHDIEIPFPHVSLYSGSRTSPLPITQVEQKSS